MHEFQKAVNGWMALTFSDDVRKDVRERTLRFIEEAMELAQALGLTADEAERMVQYVWTRPVGEPAQEVGGTMVTLSALCSAVGIDLDEAGRNELQRCFTIIDKVRAKQVTKREFMDKGTRTFRDVVIEELIVAHVLKAEHERDPAKAVHDLLSWNVEVALDPRVSHDARELIAKGAREVSGWWGIWHLEHNAWCMTVHGELFWGPKPVMEAQRAKMTFIAPEATEVRRYGQ
jgi:hypothetical protein